LKIHSFATRGASKCISTLLATISTCTGEMAGAAHLE
jgi:hypothetical protein